MACFSFLVYPPQFSLLASLTVKELGGLGSSMDFCFLTFVSSPFCVKFVTFIFFVNVVFIPDKKRGQPTQVLNLIRCAY